MFRKNKNSGRNNARNNRIKPKKPTVENRADGTTVIKNIPLSELVPVTIKDHGDSNGGHPHAIMDNIDNCHVSVGLSTKKTKGRNGGNNYTMEKSPLDDGQQSYMRRQAVVRPTREYSNQRQGTMTKKDHAQAKKYAEKAKQKYIEKKDKKKVTTCHCFKH